MTPNRTCGPCTVCCRVLAVQTLGKSADVLCRHSTDAGCGIYAERPGACARWFCLWRKVDALPEALRPDRSGVMFSLERRPPCPDAPEGACIVGRAAHRQGTVAVDDRNMAEAFAMFVREGSLPVWRVSGGDAVLLSPIAIRSDA